MKLSTRSFCVRTLACAAFALILSACNGGGSGGDLNVAPSGFVPIANCVVDSQEDVVIGGSNAPPGCMNVEMEPSKANPSAFGDIRIEQGGVLLVASGGSQSQAAAKRAVQTSSESIPLGTLETPVRDFCVGNGGKLEVIDPNSKEGQALPVKSSEKVVMQFQGKPGETSKDPECAGFAKGIDVAAGGTLIMKGAKGVQSLGDGKSWTTLSRSAGPEPAGAAASTTGPMTLNLTANVQKGEDPWQPGDWIVVATTNFVPFDSEFVQIDSVTKHETSGCGQSTDGCSTVTLMQPLKYYHFGSEPPSTGTSCADPLYPAKSETANQPAFLCDGPARNYGVDERAEVGLISRDIELTADTSESGAQHWGGEIMIHQGYKKVVLEGVRLSKFGKDKLGSYPIHFHLVGDIDQSPNPGAASTVVDADSVDHSYNKCVTIHATSNLTISNLVCARIVGHIFYEELESQGQKNPSDDSNLVFDHDLGIGAMSNDFDIYAAKAADGTEWTRQQMIDKYWWAGDYMTNADCGNYCIGYDGFNIPDTDNQMQAARGKCWKEINRVNGQFEGLPDPNDKVPCAPGWYYLEPASGFWIQNPTTVLTDNAIAGCQGVGVAYWWNSPGSGATTLQDGTVADLSTYPLGKVDGDRASGCYWGYNDAQELHVIGQQLLPRKGGVSDSPPLVATLTNITASYIRRRAVWLRPLWFVIKDGHFADNNRSVTLVTSGGVDGNAAGVWELLEDSVLVGVSRNNVGRWGPCPKTGAFGDNTGWTWGCIDYSHPKASEPAPHSGELNGLGYPSPARNSFGYMIYDGPVRIFHDRFVNYNYDNPNGTGDEFSGELDAADRTDLETWQTANAKSYEGDAALGWFDSNQNAYPVTTVSKQLTWVNSNFRHQIYTEHVGLDNFNDGDKNTAIVDDDGTLDNLGTELAPGAGTDAIPEHPISLNNLPFNATSNSVDECFSRGAQNEAIEGRDTSLMSPAPMAQLELSDLYPYKTNVDFPNYPGLAGTHYQHVIFTRTDKIPNGKGGEGRPDMTLIHGRNGQGMWEPKVASGYGYYVKTAKSPGGSEAGMWKWIEVGLVDAEDPNISSAHPFYIKLGINYTTSGGGHPQNGDAFTITRGYKSYTGGGIPYGPQYADGSTNHLLDYWTDWRPACNGLDDHNRGNVPHDGQPAGCPASNAQHPPMVLTKVNAIGELYDPNTGKPRLDVYYYNPDTGYLWFNLAQDEPNPVEPSPTGSCQKDEDGGIADPSCPDTADGETYYACPEDGCIIYSIDLDVDNYMPGPTPATNNPAAASLAPPPSTNQADHNQLVAYGTSTVITRTAHVDKQNMVYFTPDNAPPCVTTEAPESSPQQ